MHIVIYSYILEGQCVAFGKKDFLKMNKEYGSAQPEGNGTTNIFSEYFGEMIYTFVVSNLEIKQIRS